MKFKEIDLIATKYLQQLCPYCERLEIAGSIRRKRPSPNDIELVAIPKMVPVNDDLFTQGKEVHPDFIKIVNSWEKIKGLPTGKYTQRMLPEGIKLDLFMCDRDNWGLIFAIRTGNWQFSKWLMGTKVKEVGLQVKGGRLWQGNERISCPEEANLFELLSLEYIKPEERER